MGATSDQPVVAAGQMRPHARPRPILGALDEPRPDRIHRDIARRRHQVVLVHHDR
jgi:hypothetical protein